MGPARRACELFVGRLELLWLVLSPLMLMLVPARRTHELFRGRFSLLWLVLFPLLLVLLPLLLVPTLIARRQRR